MRNLEEFNGKHVGQPCFIIGSGPSINCLNLAPLEHYVTIACNGGFVAHPKATYFLSDDWDVSNWSYFMIDLRAAMNTIVLMYEDKLKYAAHIFGGRSVLFRHRRGYDVTDKYEHEVKENRIVQARSSIGTAIHVAHIMECSPIILLGVDCCRTGKTQHRWFWQDKVGDDRPTRLDDRRLDKYSTVENSDTDLQDILSYWEMAGPRFRDKCSVYNASPISLVDAFERIDLNQWYKEHGKI